MIHTKLIKINNSFPEPEKINQAVKVLSKGGLVAFPTETVYGLAANFNDKRATEKLLEVKKRPSNKPFPLLIERIDKIDDFSNDVLPVGYRLADKFWPGALTLIFPSLNTETIGLRMPKSIIALELVKRAGFPLACPSANFSGEPPALNSEDVMKYLAGKIDLVLDGGRAELGVSSTVVDVCQLPVKILREGAIKKETIQEVASRKRILFVCTGNSCRSVMAKALLEKKLTEKSRKDIEVDSAGVAAPLGLGASYETKQLLQEEGIDVSAHQAKSINLEMLKRQDLILVMQRFQEEEILRKYSFLKGRVYLLKEFSRFDNNNLEIEDPIGRGMEVYKKSFRAIKGAVARLVDLI